MQKVNLIIQNMGVVITFIMKLPYRFVILNKILNVFFTDDGVLT